MLDQVKGPEPAEVRSTAGMLARLGTVLRPRDIPIRLKLLLALVSLVAVSATIVSLTLIRFFQDDKTTYIRDLEADIAANTAASLEGSIRRYSDRLERISRELVADRDASAGLWTQLVSDPDCVFLGLYDAGGRNLIGLYRQDDIERVGLSSIDFMATRQAISVESATSLRGRRARPRPCPRSPRAKLGTRGPAGRGRCLERGRGGARRSARPRHDGSIGHVGNASQRGAPPSRRRSGLERCAPGYGSL